MSDGLLNDRLEVSWCLQVPDCSRCDRAFAEYVERNTALNSSELAHTLNSDTVRSQLSVKRKRCTLCIDLPGVFLVLFSPAIASV